jgi:membrane protease YdiL (CAAX protease family)
MEFAAWRPAPGRLWAFAAVGGLGAGLVALWFASVLNERIAVATNWRLLLLQTVLGPVLEELLFRGYLLRVLLWVHGAQRRRRAKCASVVLISALAFGASHVLRPGTGIITVGVITTLGTLYGYIRMTSGSTATAAVAHAAYNATLYVGMAI